MNITKEELSKISQQYGRSARISKNLFNMLNEFNPSDFKVAMDALKEVYEPVMYNEKIMKSGRLAIWMEVSRNIQLTPEADKVCLKYYHHKLDDFHDGRKIVYKRE